MRIGTRPDMDGLTCAVLLRTTEDVCLIHPQDISDRRFEVVDGDIIGELAACYGGGGHPRASSIPLIDEADFQVRQIISELNSKE